VLFLDFGILWLFIQSGSLVSGGDLLGLMVKLFFLYIKTMQYEFMKTSVHDPVNPIFYGYTKFSGGSHQDIDVAVVEYGFPMVFDYSLEKDL